MSGSTKPDKNGGKVIILLIVATSLTAVYFTNADARYFLTGVGRFFDSLASGVFVVFSAIGGKP
jgi:hypothetical protein